MTDLRGPLRRVTHKARLAAHEVVDLGPRTMAAIVANSVQLEREHRREVRAARTVATTRSPGPLLEWSTLTDHDSTVRGVAVQFAESDLAVEFLADDLVRVTWGPGIEPLPWALGGNRSWDAPGDVTVTAVAGRGCRVSSSALDVMIGADATLSYVGATGRLIRTELAPLRRGETRLARFVLRDGERIAGLGEQASPLDLRGSTHRLWNRDPGGAWGPGQDPLYCAIPVMVGLHPDGDVLTFYENSHDARVVLPGHGRRELGSSSVAELTFSAGTLRHYVTVGDLPTVLSRYGQLTGTAPLPPRWALGYHQCRWGYKSEGDVREVADGFAAEGLPLSAIHLDIDYMDGYRVFSVNAERFPDLGQLCDDLGQRGTQVVTIVDPAIRRDPDFEIYRQGVDGGHFVTDAKGGPLFGTVWPGWAAFPDFTDPEARRWWAGCYAGLVDAGVSGFWHDMNEPTSITLWGDRTLPGDARHSAEGRGGDHREAHNVYGLLMDRAGFEAQETMRPGHRPFVLSRAGWAGLAKWAWHWTADIESSWEGLAQQVPTVAGLGLSGVPYSGSDIGGFSGIPSPELFLRWLELSVLQPFCRTHSVLGATPREPWRFPEPYRIAIGNLIRLRYRLLPYLYSLAWDAAELGHPLVRPLSWPPDPRWTTGPGGDHSDVADDAYLLGDALLVAPVVAPGATSRDVRLPVGMWYRWRSVPAIGDTGDWAGDSFEPVDGGRTVCLDAPAGQPLMLVRGGSILPLDDAWMPSSEVESADAGRLDRDHAARHPSMNCFVDLDGRASGTAFDDDGDGNGMSRVDRFDIEPGGEGSKLHWRREGDFPGPASCEVVVHTLGGIDNTVQSSRTMTQALASNSTSGDVELPRA